MEQQLTMVPTPVKLRASDSYKQQSNPAATQDLVEQRKQVLGKLQQQQEQEDAHQTYASPTRQGLRSATTATAGANAFSFAGNTGSPAKKGLRSVTAPSVFSNLDTSQSSNLFSIVPPFGNTGSKKEEGKAGKKIAGTTEVGGKDGGGGGDGGGKKEGKTDDLFSINIPPASKDGGGGGKKKDSLSTTFSLGASTTTGMFAVGGMGGSEKGVKGFGGFEGFGTTTASTTTAAAPAVLKTMTAPTTPPPATAPSGNTTPPANTTTPPSVIKPKIQFATSANSLAATDAFTTGSTTGGAVGAAGLVTLGKKGVLGSGKPKNLFGQPTATTPAAVGFGASTLPQQQQLQQPQQPNFAAMLTEFYQHVGETGKCYPQHIQKALNKYKGNETKMFMKMIKKYKDRIQSSYAVSGQFAVVLPFLFVDSH